MEFSEEQILLRGSLSGYLIDHHDFEARNKAIASGEGRRANIWRGFAELGILAASFPEALGGLGGGALDTFLIMEELGKALVIEPYLDTVVFAGDILKRCGHPRAAERIAAIADGSDVYAVAYIEPHARYTWSDIRTIARKEGAGYALNGLKAMVAGAPWANRLIVTARTDGAQRDAKGVSLFLLDMPAAGITRRDYRTVDGQRASDIVFERVLLPADALISEAGGGFPLFEAAVDAATVAVCAEACGVMRKLLEGTIAYTKQREQFGQTISRFQVVQHRLADMFIQLEQSLAMTYLACAALEGEADARGRAASAAKAQVGKACKFVGQNAIQLHGGMGITDELAIGHYFKRATVIEGLFGSTDHHLTRYERLSFPPVRSAQTA